MYSHSPRIVFSKDGQLLYDPVAASVDGNVKQHVFIYTLIDLMITVRTISMKTYENSTIQKEWLKPELAQFLGTPTWKTLLKVYQSKLVAVY